MTYPHINSYPQREKKNQKKRNYYYRYYGILLNKLEPLFGNIY